MKFHCLVNSSVPCTDEYTGDAFNQLARRFAVMLALRGHTVYFYGNVPTSLPGFESSRIFPVLTMDDYENVKEKFGSLNSGEYLSPAAELDCRAELSDKYCSAAQHLLEAHTAPGDFLLHFSTESDGLGRMFPELVSIALVHMGPTRAPFTYTVFCSGVHLGNNINTHGDKNAFPLHPAVIPPIFDPDQFTYQETARPKTFLYLARIQTMKGAMVLLDLARKRPDCTFWLAGYARQCSGGLIIDGKDTNLPSNVIYQGFADADKRRRLLADATALIQPSQYEEPFGYNVIEAYLSGTPVITSNTGTFIETVKKHTGIRCSSLDEYSSALDDIAHLKREDCLSEGMCYTSKALYPRYIEYFCAVHAIEMTPHMPTEALLRLARAYISRQKYLETFKTLRSVDESALTEAQLYLTHHLYGVCSFYIGRKKIGKERCMKAILMNGSLNAMDKSNLQCYLQQSVPADSAEAGSTAEP